MAVNEYIEREASKDGADAITMQEINLSNLFHASDVTPVPPARWKYYKKQNIAVCTNCSFERDLDLNFGRAISCTSCGAIMDEEVAE